MTDYFNLLRNHGNLVVKTLHIWTFKTPSFALKFHIGVNLSFFLSLTFLYCIF